MELKPLVAAYKSNLVMGLTHASTSERLRGRGAVARLEILERQIDQALNLLPAAQRPHAPRSVARSSNSNNQIVPVDQAPRLPTRPPITNALLITDYIEIPYQRLRQNLPREEISRVRITSEHSDAGKLWPIVRYHQAYYEYQINRMIGHDRDRSAAFVWDSSEKIWEVISIPAATAPTNWTPKESAALMKDALYISGWTYLRRYGLKSRQWQDVAVPWQKPVKLSRIGDRLFAGNEEAIFEISGKTVRILASTR
ncbi:MAG TPA: hypothetical protein VFW05_07435 [Verrucomicrobiae bacterium]|nr:hypothetical protein [Verrucomicrobiae bacterium]